MYTDDQLLALSGLQHLSFCERQWALIHVEQIWSDNADTLRGDFFHERVDTAGYSCIGGVRSERRVRLVNRRLGIYGAADIVEFDLEDPTRVKPVEYKVGKPKVEDWDRVQLAAQALCLEEMLGVDVPEGALFYGETRRREQVAVDDDLRSRVEGLAARAHDLFDRGETPRAVLKPKCKRCSLLDDCLPAGSQHDARDYWACFDVTLEA